MEVANAAGVQLGAQLRRDGGPTQAGTDVPFIAAIRLIAAKLVTGMMPGRISMSIPAAAT